MQDSTSNGTSRRSNGRTSVLLSVFVLALVSVCASVAWLWEDHRRRTQMQNDPQVARAWVVGETFGPRHHIKRGATLQKWLNSHNIRFLGDYEELDGQYGTDLGSMEIWLNYESYLGGQPDLECHRADVEGTAFVDDLGQQYHGYLEIHGKTVAVYLPGYDHSAHEMRCMLRWMPRRPAPPHPRSHPMVFTVKLPPHQRVLPAAPTLPRIVTAQKGGITVTLNAARLGAFKQTARPVGQRDLTFHLKVTGGEIVNDNVGSDLDLSIPDSSKRAQIRAAIGRSVSLRGSRSFVPGKTLGFQFPTTSKSGKAFLAQRQLRAFTNAAYDQPMYISDPYGMPLIAPGQTVSPLISKETLRSARRGEGVIWTVPVNNAGRGTDVMRVHFDVLPAPKPGQTVHDTPIPFDLAVPVQTGDEI